MVWPWWRTAENDFSGEDVICREACPPIVLHSTALTIILWMVPDDEITHTLRGIGATRVTTPKAVPTTVATSSVAFLSSVQLRHADVLVSCR